MLILQVIDVNFPNLTSCCFQEVDPLTGGGGHRTVSLVRQISGMMVLKAELKSTLDRISGFFQMLQDVMQSLVKKSIYLKYIYFTSGVQNLLTYLLTLETH